MRITVSEEHALINAHQVVESSGFALDPADRDPTPERQVVDWLGALRLLHDVPFEYIVPDHGLLEPETIRFFHVDRNWTDAAVEGALAACTFGTRDRSLLEANRDAILDAVDDAERSHWPDEPLTGEAATPAGFLLRSQAVSGWPALEAVGFRNDRRLALLRMERLAPAVLLVVFDNVPDAVELREPRQGIQFGVTSDGNKFQVVLRAVDANGQVSDALDGQDNPVMVDVPFRQGAAGVINVEDLAEELIAAGTGLGTVVDSAEFAVQMMRYPVVQRFADEDLPDDNNAPSNRPFQVLEGSFTLAEEVDYLHNFNVDWRNRHV